MSSMASATTTLAGPLEGATVARAKISLAQRFQNISLREIALFFRFLSTLLEAGLPLTRALHFGHLQAKSPLLKQTIASIINDIDSGRHLSEALARFPQFFSELVVQMIVVGENSGELANMTAKINGFMENRLENRANLKSAMAYPAILLISCIGVVFFMLTSAVPQLAAIFENMGAQLPGITVFFLNLGKFLNVWGWIIGLGMVIGAAGFYLWSITEEGTVTWDRWKLHIPFFGTLTEKIAASQFASTLSILLAGGVSTLKSLEVTAFAAENTHVRRQLFFIRSQVAEGESLTNALKSANLFSDVVFAMVAVGEESGELDRMLLHVQAIYDQEVDIATKTFTRLIEPVMILAMTGIVGIIAASILIPLADLSSAIK